MQSVEVVDKNRNLIPEKQVGISGTIWNFSNS
jgi:hypothetical protein